MKGKNMYFLCLSDASAYSVDVLKTRELENTTRTIIATLRKETLALPREPEAWAETLHDADLST